MNMVFLIKVLELHEKIWNVKQKEENMERKNKHNVKSNTR